MKAVFIALFFFVQLSAMDLDRLSLEESSMQSIKLKVTEGADHGWHFLSSLVQAIICPTAVIYFENEIYFTHYEYSFIKYFESYRKIQEWLPLISQSKFDLEEAARAIINTCDSSQSLTEVQKFRVARAWLHTFLNDSPDSPLTVKRKRYIDALKTSDPEQLAVIAPQIAHYTTNLMDEIIRRQKEMVP
jgi:hypothetical protein